MDCKKCHAPLPELANFCPACGKPVAPTKRRKRKRAQGTGSIKKLSGNRQKPWAAWKDGIYIDTFRTYAEADAAIGKLTADDISDRYNITFGKFFEDFKKVQFRERKLSESQRKVYEFAFTHCPQLHPVKMRSLRKADYTAAIMAMEQQNYSESSCQKLAQLFSAMDDYAQEAGIISRTHASNLRTEAKQKRITKNFVKADLPIIAAAKGRAVPIVMLLCATGCRPSELFKVPTANCMDTYIITGSKTAAGRDRLIPIAAFGQPYYQALLAKAKAKNLPTLVAAYPGNSDAHNFAKRDFQELMEELGYEGYTPYSCRHTLGTLLAESGASAKAIKLILGHADETTQETYIHPSQDFVLQTVAQIHVDL